MIADGNICIILSCYASARQTFVVNNFEVGCILKGKICTAIGGVQC